MLRTQLVGDLLTIHAYRSGKFCKASPGIKGPVTRCNFSCNLQCNSTFGRCKIGKYTFSSQFAEVFLTYKTFGTNLHLLRVELRCKLQEKLQCVTGP